MAKESIGIGIIGTGFMGRCHALAFRAAPAVFNHLPPLQLACVADLDVHAAEQAAATYGFSRSTSDWRALVADPTVDVVSITTPNYLHQEMALAAIAAGKHVYCEKPLALDGPGAEAMAAAALGAGVTTLVGYNYLHNPIISFARDLISSGDLGEIFHFRGAHFEDFMADPRQPFSWRCDRSKAGAGAIADLGSHIISIARRLAGDIETVAAALQTVIRERPVAAGSSVMREVDVDDQAQLLVRFASGAAGTIEASTVAAGRKMTLAFEITGSKGSLCFDQERMNELRLFTYGADPARDGFKTILAGPHHPPYGAFCPAPGHGLGFNDLKVIEVCRLIEGIVGETKPKPDFFEAAQIARIVDAAIRADSAKSWTRIDSR